MLAGVFLTSALGACSSVGPATVERDRIDYETAIADSWKQQTLLNIVKIRYGDFPVFLEVAQVIAGYQLESTVAAGFNAAGTSGGTVNPFTFGGSALAQGKYTDRPTVVYSPLTGNDFLKKLMTPIPPSALLNLLQSGYNADLVMSTGIDSINGISNGSQRSKNRAVDPQFLRLTQLLRDLQLANAIQVRINAAKDGQESTLLVFSPNTDPELAAKTKEIGEILHLKPGLREFSVFYGGYSGKDNEIAIMTRSMLQIMIEMAALVQVPASDVTEGRAAPGAVEGQIAMTSAAPLMKIESGDAQPRDAFDAIHYNDRWFWVANTDLRSKYSMGFIMLLFSISETGMKAGAPVVTVPTN